MKLFSTTLAAGTLALAVAGPALAHGQVRVRVAAAPYYYPPVVQVVPRYAPPPVYYVVADPAWEARRDMAWRYAYRHRGHGRHHHHHHHGHHGRHGGYGYY